MTALTLPPLLSPRFTALSQLHRGRMGIAYRARSAAGDEGVLRLLDTSLCRSAPDRVRITRELQKLATVVHPSLAVPSEIGEDGGQLWYFRPFIEGESLADWMARGPMPVDQALGLGGQVADALHALHRAGLLHRDLCPERIILAGEGRVVLVDAVVAATVDDHHDRIFGSAPFVSPEEVDGKPTSFRSDLYSLGMVLCSALVGEPPFDGPIAKVLEAHLREAPPPLAVELNAEVRGLLDQLLDKEPRCRPFSAQKVAKTLAAYVPQALRVVEKLAAVPSAAPPPQRTPKATLLGVPAMMPPVVQPEAATAPPAESPTAHQPGPAEPLSDSGSSRVPTRTMLGMPSPVLQSSSDVSDDSTQPLEFDQVVGAREVHGPSTDVTPTVAFDPLTATFARPDPTEPVGPEQIVDVRPSHRAPPAWPGETARLVSESPVTETVTLAQAAVPVPDAAAPGRAADASHSTNDTLRSGDDAFPLEVADLEDTEDDGSVPGFAPLKVSSAPPASTDGVATDPFAATLTAPLPRRSTPPPLPPRTSAPPPIPPHSSDAPLPRPRTSAPPPIPSMSVGQALEAEPVTQVLAPWVAPSTDVPTTVEPVPAAPATKPKRSPLKLALILGALLASASACIVGGWVLLGTHDDVTGSPPATAAGPGMGTLTAPATVLDAGSVPPRAPDVGVADGLADVGVADGVADVGVADVGVADVGVADVGVSDEPTMDDLTFMRGPRPRSRAERARWLALRRAAAASSMMNTRPSATNTSATARLQERARAATAAGNHAEATQLYEQLTRQSPSNAAAWFALGQSRMRQRNGRGAAAALQTATSLSPRNATYWATLGAARRNSGDASGARAAFQQALRIDPNNQTAQRGLSQ